MCAHLASSPVLAGGGAGPESPAGLCTWQNLKLPAHNEDLTPTLDLN